MSRGGRLRRLAPAFGGPNTTRSAGRPRRPATLAHRHPNAFAPANRWLPELPVTPAFISPSNFAKICNFFRYTSSYG